MRGKVFILLVLLFVGVAQHYSFAQQDTTAEQQDTTAEQQTVAPTSKRDTLVLGDSIVVIHTVCAPICSSHARVYNKEWQPIGELQAPFTSIFPEAYIEDGQLLWRDNDTLDYTPCL